MLAYPVLLKPSYRNAILALNPLSYWPMTELTGTTMFDTTTTAIANGNGTYTATPTLGDLGMLSGQPGGAVTFNGTSQYSTVAANVVVDYVDAFTLLAWIRRGATGATRGIISRGANTGYMRVSATGTLNILKSNVAVIATSVGIIPTEACMVAVTKNAGDVHIYIQGAEDTGTVTNQTCATGGGLLVGADTSATQFFNGTIGHAAIWNVALPGSAIAKLCQIGRGF